MSEFYVVVDHLNDWSPYYPSQDVIDFNDYLNRIQGNGQDRIRIINLSRRYKYLSTGYYCSLLAEARGHHVLPTVSTLNDVNRMTLTRLQLEPVVKHLNALQAGKEGDERLFRCWFGSCLQEDLLPIAREVFERFPCPILEITLMFRKHWQVKHIRPASLADLTDPEEQTAFANRFEGFSSKIWRKPRARKIYNYDLAILADPEEKMPPSDKKALKSFIRAANELGIAAELIGKKDYMRIPEYDGLFIRETTGVNHHTYRFAKKAEMEDLVVIDDPNSILRCTNKIYLADLLKTQGVPTPATEIFAAMNRDTLDRLADRIGFPMVLKIPDGSFSRGIVKVNDMNELREQARKLMQNSALLLAQEFLYTHYDWRIGILNNKPLFACRYYMVDDHWQIYQHGSSRVESGDFDTLPTFEVPREVLDVALRATRPIGNGFYGVDIKQDENRVVVLEVNDNPSIESGVEDGYLGQQLYSEIMEEFLRRMKARRDN